MPKARKPSGLRPFKTLKIFCEGEKTEPNYLRGYIGTLESEARKAVVEVQKTDKNTPLQLVEEAIRAKNSSSSLPEDEFWVVYDREAKNKYSDEAHAKAYDKAKIHGIEVAICNVCFEYWLLIHFVVTDAPFHNYDDLRRNSQLNDRVRQATGQNYDKSCSMIFSTVKSFVPTARQRGAQLNKRVKESAEPGKGMPYHLNPYVGIVDLLDAIDKFV